ncbi:carbohydrate kinase family protein [Methanopyrus sp.]
MDVVGLGALNVDELLYVPRMPERDDSVPVERRVRRGGGSAANTICWLAYLGRKVGFVGKVGSDDAGDFLLRELEKHGVDTSRVVRNDGRSGTAFCLVSGNDRRILVDPGVNDELRLDEVDIDYIREARVLHTSSFIGLRSETSLETLRETMETVAGELTVTFSPATMVLRGWSYLKPYFEAADVVFLNETEAVHLTGDVEETLDRLAEFVEVVVITRGSDPTIVREGTETLEVAPEPVPEEEIVDPTGAGDAFAAGFIDGLIRNEPADRCCEHGHAVAAECLRVEGCRPPTEGRSEHVLGTITSG